MRRVVNTGQQLLFLHSRLGLDIKAALTHLVYLYKITEMSYPDPNTPLLFFTLIESSCPENLGAFAHKRYSAASETKLDWAGRIGSINLQPYN